MVALVIILTDVAPAQLPGATTTPRTGLTREELTRSWDLDGDGTISKAEAEVAKARMKRERAELQLGPGNDPVTGLPRMADAEPNSGLGQNDIRADYVTLRNSMDVVRLPV